MNSVWTMRLTSKKPVNFVIGCGFDASAFGILPAFGGPHGRHRHFFSRFCWKTRTSSPLTRSLKNVPFVQLSVDNKDKGHVHLFCFCLSLRNVWCHHYVQVFSKEESVSLSKVNSSAFLLPVNHPWELAKLLTAQTFLLILWTTAYSSRMPFLPFKPFVFV